MKLHRFLCSNRELCKLLPRLFTDLFPRLRWKQVLSKAESLPITLLEVHLVAPNKNDRGSTRDDEASFLVAGPTSSHL